jgi:hypothetical protein
MLFTTTTKKTRIHKDCTWKTSFSRLSAKYSIRRTFCHNSYWIFERSYYLQRGKHHPSLFDEKKTKHKIGALFVVFTYLQYTSGNEIWLTRADSVQKLFISYSLSFHSPITQTNSNIRVEIEYLKAHIESVEQQFWHSPHFGVYMTFVVFMLFYFFLRNKKRKTSNI